MITITVDKTLKKCPSKYCEKYDHANLSVYGLPDDMWRLQCNRCGVQTQLVKGYETALYEWNKGRAT